MPGCISQLLLADWTFPIATLQIQLQIRLEIKALCMAAVFASCWQHYATECNWARKRDLHGRLFDTVSVTRICANSKAFFDCETRDREPWLSWLTVGTSHH